MGSQPNGGVAEAWQLFVERVEERIERENPSALRRKGPDERRELADLALAGLARAYGPDEPEYTEADIKKDTPA